MEEPALLLLTKRVKETDAIEYIMLSNTTKQQLMQRFPDVELSYDRTLHKKVYADLYMVVPKGPKAFIWITYWNGDNVAFLMSLNHRGDIKDIEPRPMCFDDELALGTVLYGTTFDVGGNTFFSCEDIFTYKGNNTSRLNLERKLGIVKEMFDGPLRQKTYGSNFVVPGLPIWAASFQGAINATTSLPYRIYGIKLFRNKDHGREALGIHVIKERVIPEAIFRVKATIQADVYNLFCFEHGKGPFKPYGTAAVASYKNSVMMNSLFRIIKENGNLDLLEESDDEEEFEDVRDDKYVDLRKQLIMKCVYNKRFKKWEPVEVIKEKTNIVTRREAQLLEKKV